MNFACLADAFLPSRGSVQVRSGRGARRLLNAALAIAFAGAASVSRAQELTQIDVPAADSAEMTYSAFDPTHALISERALLAALQHVAEAATRYPLKTEHEGYFNYTKGLRVGVDSSKHLLNLHYESLRQHARDASIGTKRTFSIAYTLTQGGDVTHIVLEFPKQAQEEVRSEILNPTPKLWDGDDINADYQRVAEALHGPELLMNTMAQGEIESKYKPDVVLANLDRMLGHMQVGVPTGPSTEPSSSPTSGKSQGLSTRAVENCSGAKSGRSRKTSSRSPLIFAKCSLGHPSANTCARNTAIKGKMARANHLRTATAARPCSSRHQWG